MRAVVFFVIVTALLAVGAYLLQSAMYLSSDVGILLYDTQLLLAGGNYASHLFETNPPMIFYLYLPVCLISKMFSLDLIMVMRMYVIMYALISVACCGMLLKKIINQQDRFLLYVFLYTLLFVLLFLPAREFGQREQFFVILTLPYFLAAVLVAQKKSLNTIAALFIGIIAGLGFSLKPYFLFPLVLVEIYLMFSTRRWFSWVRIEAISCASVILVYLISVVIFHPDYFSVILRFVSDFYFMGTQESWSAIFFRTMVIFCFLALLYALIVYKKQSNRELVSVLILILIGMIAAFLVTRTGWYYHVLPAVSVAFLLTTFLLIQIFSKQIQATRFSLSYAIFLLSANLIIFYVPLSLVASSYVWGIQTKRHSNLTQMVAYFNAIPGKKSIYCFSGATSGDCFPLIYLTNSTLGGKGSFFWWLRGMLKIEHKAPLSSHLAEEKVYLINQIADNLEQFRTKYVIIDTDEEERGLGGHFNFINYFSTNKKFQAEWKKYRYSTQIGYYQIYKRIT